QGVARMRRARRVSARFPRLASVPGRGRAGRRRRIRHDAPGGRRMKNASRIRRWSGYVVIAILFAVACAFLSNWQFTRNEQRAHANGLIANNYHAAPVPLDELVEGTSGFDPEDEWRPVELTGEYLADEQLLARNRAHGNTNAYESLVPFQLDDGRIMLVDRGW